MKLCDLQNGDLLFMNDATAISKAITGIARGSVYSHVGIFFDGMVYHATLKKGVNKQDLVAYLEEEKKIVDVFRFPHIDAKMVKDEAEKYIGLPYNFSFYPDGEGMYCSQYLAKILPVFETVPMKFGDGKNEISEYWKNYFIDLGVDVPVDLPGTNPYQLSLSEKLVFIESLSF